MALGAACNARRAIQSKRLKPSVSLAEACLQRYIVRSFVPSPAALLMVATGCFSDNHNCCTAKSTLGMVMSNIIQAKNSVVFSDTHAALVLDVYRKVASSNMSCLKAHAGFFRLLMKGIFDPYVL